MRDHGDGLRSRKNLNLEPCWNKPPSQGGQHSEKERPQKPHGELLKAMDLGTYLCLSLLSVTLGK